MNQLKNILPTFLILTASFLSFISCQGEKEESPEIEIKSDEPVNTLPDDEVVFINTI